MLVKNNCAIEHIGSIFFINVQCVLTSVVNGNILGGNISLEMEILEISERVSEILKKISKTVLTIQNKGEYIVTGMPCILSLFTF